MTCPPAVATILLDILTGGLLRVRAAAASGDATLAAIEADHLHNIPALLQHYSPEVLRYYWEVERPDYAARISTAARAEWAPLWSALRAAADLEEAETSFKSWA
jgi:hypothetical protein